MSPSLGKGKVTTTTATKTANGNAADHTFYVIFKHEARLLTWSEVASARVSLKVQCSSSSFELFVMSIMQEDVYILC